MPEAKTSVIGFDNNGKPVGVWHWVPVTEVASAKIELRYNGATKFIFMQESEAQYVFDNLRPLSAVINYRINNKWVEHKPQRNQIGRGWALFQGYSF